MKKIENGKIRKNKKMGCVSSSLETNVLERIEERNRNFFIYNYVNALCNIRFLSTHFQLNTYEDLCIFITKNPKINCGRLELYESELSSIFSHFFEDASYNKYVHVKQDIVSTDVLNKIVEQLIVKKNEIFSNLDNDEKEKRILKNKLEKAQSDLSFKDIEISEMKKKFNKEKNNLLDKYDPLKLISYNSKIEELKDQRKVIAQTYDDAKYKYENYENINAIKNIELFICIVNKKMDTVS
jgi:hypothetical protein